MLILRIKQAECALADGRLDEALEVAQADDVRRHRHGQRLIGRLTRALLHRGRENLDAGQLQPALADCNKAERLAGNLSEVAELRAAVCTAILKEQQGRQHDALRVAQVRRQVAEGWLSVGEQLLGEASADDGQARLLRQELDAARLQTADAVAKAERALKSGDIEAAVDLIRASGIRRSRNGQVGELLRRIGRLAGEQVRASLEQGRVDRAQSLLQRLSPLGVDGEEIAELRRALTQCNQAAEFVATGRPGAALPLLRKAKAICGSARWLDAAIANVKQAAQALDDLDAGPLGLSIADAGGTQEAWKIEPDGHDRKPGDIAGGDPGPGRPMMSDVDDNGSVPSSFVMQMDGIGSFLVFRDARITVGPISSSKRPTLGLMAEPGLPVVSIERTDGDYFIHADKPIEVNGDVLKEKLLADGDRIALSPRCRLRFHLPNAASTTAVLTLSGARLGRPDISQVILMGRDILVGPYTNNHIRTEQLDETVTFFGQNGRFLCRSGMMVSVDERPMQPSEGLTMDKPIRIGRLSMVLAKFRA